MDMPTSVGVEIHPHLQQSADHSWHRKEAGCAEEDHFDIVPQVDFYKDGELICSALAPHISRDHALAIARILTGPTKADVVVMSVDAHVTNSQLNPKTGQPWGPGEMQAACDDDGACAVGLLQDCIHTVAVFRDGTTQGIQRRYSGHETKGAMKWEEPDAMPRGANLGGMVTDVLLEAMSFDYSGVEADMEKGRVEEGLSVEEAYWLSACAGVQLVILSGAAGAVGVFAPPEYESILQGTLSQQVLQTMEASPMGPLAKLLAIKYGI